jgi:hypothetical protein
MHAGPDLLTFCDVREADVFNKICGFYFYSYKKYKLTFHDYREGIVFNNICDSVCSVEAQERLPSSPPPPPKPALEINFFSPNEEKSNPRSALILTNYMVKFTAHMGFLFWTLGENTNITRAVFGGGGGDEGNRS